MRAKRRMTALLLALLLATAPVTAAAETARWEIVPGRDTAVEFESRAPVDSFTGRTDRVSGWLEGDLDDLTAPLSLAVKVDLASFDTGIGKRNEHMRENHLETDTYPLASFTGGTVAEESAREVPVGKTVRIVLDGVLDLHGVERAQRCELTVSRPDSATLEVLAEFPVLLSDHDIKRPKFLVMKLANDQQVTARLVLRKGSSR